MEGADATSAAAESTDFSPVFDFARRFDSDAGELLRA